MKYRNDRHFCSRRRCHSRQLACEKLEHRLALAAVPFAAETVFSGGISRSQAVLGADVDGDDDPDLVALSGEAVVWFENAEAASFGEPKMVTEGLSSDGRSMDVTDIDNDGDPDVVVGTIAGDTVVVLRNSDGAGTFEDPIVVATDDDLQFVDALDTGDVDGDGDADIVAVGRLSNRIVWFENIGDATGEFSSARDVIDDVITPRAVHLADMDDDGDADLLASLSEKVDDEFGQGQFLVLFRNLDGAGTFDVAQVAQAPTEPRFMDTADVDDDGDLDVVLPAQDSGIIVWYPNDDGMGTFGVPLLIDETIEGVERVRMTDIDQDGDPDVVATADTAGVVAMYENTDGTFGEMQLISSDTRQASGLDILDIDGDDDLDVVTTSQFAAHVQVHTNQGEGQFEQTQITDDNVVGPALISTADFDSDGDLDIVTYSNDEKEISWFANDGTGQYGPQQIVAVIPQPQFFFNDLATADMDGDGDADVVASASEGSSIVWYENSDGLGTFTTQRGASPRDSGPLEVIPVDIDGDGDQDVLTANASRGTVIWQENDGSGRLRARLIAQLAENIVYRVEAGDFDADGDLDVVVGDNANTRIAWYENVDGDGDFGSARVIARDIPLTQALEAADIDGDGDTDIVAGIGTSPYAPAEAIWFENTDGTFADPLTVGQQQLTVGPNGAIGIRQLLAVDVDSDGDLDVVSPSTLESTIKWFENSDGKGTFGDEHAVATEVPGVADVASGDLNGDGAVDFAAALFDVNELAWYRNDSIRSADYDGNGEEDDKDLDILCSAVITGDGDSNFDLDLDGDVDRDDHVFMIREILATAQGDSNLDGVFDSSDFVAVFRAGQFEDAIDGNSTWATGDWHCDGDFNTTDLVIAFQGGAFVPASLPANQLVRAALDGIRTGTSVHEAGEPLVGFQSDAIAAGRQVELAPLRVDRAFEQEEFAFTSASDDSDTNLDVETTFELVPRLADLESIR